MYSMQKPIQQNEITLFERSFYKLNKIWKKKVENRDFTKKCFKVHHNDVSLKVAHLLNEHFETLNKQNASIIETFQIDLLQNKHHHIIFKNNKMWFYNMRKSDSIPANNTELQKVYSFMNFIIEQYTSGEEKNILQQNMNICACFLIWYFTTPNYYYLNNHYSYKKSKYKKWDEILYNKIPKEQEQKKRKESKSFKQQSHNDTTLLPKQELLVMKMLKYLESELDIKLEKEESYVQHARISRMLCENKIGSNKYKRMNKYYQDYQTEKEKLRKLRNNLAKTSGAIEKRGGGFIIVKQIATQATSCVNLKEEPDKNDEIPDSWEDLLDEI